MAAKKKEPTHTVGGNVDCTTITEISIDTSQCINIKILYDPALYSYLSKTGTGITLQRYMHTNMYSSTIHNS